MKKKDYPKYADKRAKKSNLFSDCLKAFLVGGLICSIGELLLSLFKYLGSDSLTASSLVCITLIFTAVILTGVGVFDDIARHAGAGTLVPITGFANAVVSPAIDTTSEGLVLGVGAKIFTIAGPVILYGTLAGVIYGVIYYIVGLF